MREVSWKKVAVDRSGVVVRATRDSVVEHNVDLAFSQIERSVSHDSTESFETQFFRYNESVIPS